MKTLIPSLSLLAVACSFVVAAKPTIELYKSPTCGCCSEWADIMEANGYHVNEHHQQDWTNIKQPFGMPSQLTSCHTAIIDGYMIEGHVPESDIARLLAERPSTISGLSAPGMPQHSPGMAKPGQVFKNFNVMAFDKKGQTHIYKQY